MPFTHSSLAYDSHGSSTRQPPVFIHGAGQVRKCWDQQFFDASFQNYFPVRFDLL